MSLSETLKGQEHTTKPLIVPGPPDVHEVITIERLCDYLTAARPTATFEIVGDRQALVTVNRTDQTFDAAVSRLRRDTRFLLEERGNHFLVYSDNAEADREVAILFELQHVPAGVLNEDLVNYSVFEKTKAAGERVVRRKVVSSANALILSGALSDVQAAVETLRTLDQPSYLVSVEVLIVEYFHGDNFDWRFNLTNAKLARTGNGAGDNGLISALNSSNDDFSFNQFSGAVQNLSILPAAGTAGAAFTGVGTLASQFRLNLTSLIRENHARIVTNPRVTVQNNQKADLTLTENFRFLATEVSAVSARATLEKIDATTSISVTPTVTSPEHIVLKIKPVLGTFTDGIDLQANNAEIRPLRDTQKTTVDCTVAMKNGETLILGGLILRTAEKATTGFAPLDRLPAAGWLFRDQREVHEFVEVAIYVTPRIIYSKHDVTPDLADISNRMLDLQARRLELMNSIAEEREYDRQARKQQDAGWARRIFRNPFRKK